MCSLIVCRRPGHRWPLIIAGNRDEMRDRPALPPGRYWPHLPRVLAGKDELAGGSWMGLTDYGLFGAVLNRHGTLGPADGKRSRGELVLNALAHADAISAARAVANLEAADYRPFNLVLADREHAFWLRNSTERSIELFEIGTGLHMITSRELDDPDDARIHLYRPRFTKAKAPDPDHYDWAAWASLLHCRIHVQPDGEEAAMFQDRASGFATVASHLVAVPSSEDRSPIFRYRDWTEEGGDFVSVEF